MSKLLLNSTALLSVFVTDSCDASCACATCDMPAPVPNNETDNDIANTFCEIFIKSLLYFFVHKVYVTNKKRDHIF